MKLSKVLIGATTLMSILLLSSCGTKADSSKGEETIGIAMPSKALERWEKDGDYMVKRFKEMGYDTDIQYAQDNVPTQVSQIENMITKGLM